MNTVFTHVNEQELHQLAEAIPYITILVAGADGDIDKEEKDWATKLTKIRSYATPEELNGFYDVVGESFAEKLEELINILPAELNARQDTINAKLTALNPIMAKMINPEGAALYKSYITFAEHVAKASGGFFRFFNVSAEERSVMGLEAIEPIELIEEEEEE